MNWHSHSMGIAFFEFKPQFGEKSASLFNCMMGGSLTELQHILTRQYMLPKCCNYAWFVLQKWGTLAVHNRIMYCLAAYAVCVLQRFKKCAAQTFLFLFTNPQNYICCYCAVNIVWEDCICTAESSPLRYWYCICADGTYKKLQQLSASIVECASIFSMRKKISYEINKPSC